MDTTSPLKKSLESISGIKTYGLDGEKMPKEEMDMLIFQASSENFAIPVKEVEEVLPPSKWHFLPGLPSYILGVINWRMEIITILSLEKLLKIPSSRLDKKRSRLIVLKVEDMVIALEVPKVVDVLTFTKESIQNIPADIQSQPQGKFFLGYVKVENRLIILLDLPKLIKQSMEEMQS